MQLQKKHSSSLLEQGLRYHQQGELQNAKNLYLKTLAEDPHNFDSLYLLGMIATQEENHSEAIHYLKAAIKENPKNAEVKFNLAVIFEKSGLSERRSHLI